MSPMWTVEVLALSHLLHSGMRWQEDGIWEPTRLSRMGCGYDLTYRPTKSIPVIMVSTGISLMTMWSNNFLCAY